MMASVQACRVLGYVMFVFSAISGVLWLILGMLEHDISTHVGSDLHLLPKHAMTSACCGRGFSIAICTSLRSHSTFSR